ncbi:hypothetical protein DDB_G0271804 [Dictyostelium discoideum AX4]|uniref:Putative uncharacterized protein DDB_G0271804 n=1 Tax=Dictyostelium discoideum TaxID=44689 RepID=Y6909_DICDI|nr:hypothetical protein DDB_G0271804 [Dictyostelium discoideum AX4]Q75JD8.1 RecName: Full=Putative uncharacterized protein DDB_G0271804 [Dictyostelium discoideum]EAL71592.1 hypothetical protein DDB_G0271804 [Dictyostelium discoideum AX4]|eukprot:XP_645483.1 hypothetical protein DDB_G0271804 [Dictyostelium discoideum AX4]
MEQYEDKSGLLLVQLNQLSDNRSKKVLQGFVKDVLTYEKSKIGTQLTDSETELGVSKSLVQSSKQQNISSTYFLDLCNKHIINSEFTSSYLY